MTFDRSTARPGSYHAEFDRRITQDASQRLIFDPFRLLNAGLRRRHGEYVQLRFDALARKIRNKRLQSNMSLLFGFTTTFLLLFFFLAFGAAMLTLVSSAGD